MIRKQFIYIAISGLVLLSVIPEGCYKPEKTQTTVYPPGPPQVRMSVSSVNDSSAEFLGEILQSQWGSFPIEDRGFYWSTLNNPTKNDSVIDNLTSFNSGGHVYFKDTLTGLTANTIYYVRAFLKYNPGKNTYVYTPEAGSDIKSFTTLTRTPMLFTNPIVEFSKSQAIAGGNITYEGSTKVIDRGVFWGLLPDAETSGTKLKIGTGFGLFSTTLTGLSPNTTYYIKAYATNNNGTGYGSENKFNSGNDTTFQKITDIDGNTYHIVTIGNQVWMAENLKTTKYNDKTPIPLVTDNHAWGERFTDAYCWYNNDETKKYGYGALYNWFSVNTGKLCPAGWHVPTIEDWTFLTDYLGGDSIAGGKLKETGTAHWFSPNIDATNESGFTALPGGLRNAYEGQFFDKGSWEIWWSSSVAPTGYYGNAYAIDLTFSEGKVLKDGDSYQYGFHVRCVKD